VRKVTPQANLNNQSAPGSAGGFLLRRGDRSAAQMRIERQRSGGVPTRFICQISLPAIARNRLSGINPSNCLWQDAPPLARIRASLPLLRLCVCLTFVHFENVVDDPTTRFTMQPESTEIKRRIRCSRPATILTAELMATAALRQPDVNEDPAAGTLLVPRSLSWLFWFGFLFAIRSNPQRPRFVGLLNRTLRMNAVARIGSFTTNRAKDFDGLRNNGDRLENAHDAPNG
jgi:hypothetical protein